MIMWCSKPASSQDLWHDRPDELCCAKEVMRSPRVLLVMEVVNNFQDQQQVRDSHDFMDVKFETCKLSLKDLPALNLSSMVVCRFMV